VIVVDSSVWISHFYNVLHPEVQILRSIIAAETILMGELIFLEVSMGAKSEKNARYLEQSLGQFTSTTMLERSTVEAAGLNYRRLRAQGITPRKTRSTSSSAPTASNMATNCCIAIAISIRCNNSDCRSMAARPFPGKAGSGLSSSDLIRIGNAKKEGTWNTSPARPYGR
jgi:predicted nucleic acid-binding protein